MENTRPDKRIQLEFRLHHGLAVDKEVEIQVSADREKIVFNVFHLLHPPHNLHIFHFVGDPLVERLDNLLLQLESKLILGEVAQTLVHQPQMHVGNGVLNVEVFFELKRVHKLPRVLVEQEALKNLR
jgi:hypothetical protein